MIILCTVDITTREVTIPSDQRIASYDHNVDVIRFQVETISGFSLNTSSIKIAAQGPNKARHDYAVDPSTVQIEEETGYITFDWPIPAGVTEMSLDTFKYGDTGQLIFAVCAEIISGSTVSKAWHSDDGIITVVAHLEPESGGGEDPEEEATNAQKIGQLQSDVAVINTQIGALANGSPTPIATVAEMTDESAVYLYTGSETGYTAGNWYYYDGSAWTSGGQYGGAVTSTTFNQQGVPADDFAVGEALADKADADDVTAIDERVTGVEDDVEAVTEQVMQDEAEQDVTVYTDTPYDQDSSALTMEAGYPNKYGVLTSGDRESNKTFYLQIDHDCEVYMTCDHYYYFCVYNTQPFVAANTVVRMAHNSENIPTADNPYHVTAGQFVAIGLYMAYPCDFTIHTLVGHTEQQNLPTVIGTLKTRVTAVENEVFHKIPWKYGIDKVLCIGDSLTYGSPADSSTMPYPISQNYPYYLGRMLGLTNTGDITNAGVPNYGAKTYFHNKFSDYTFADYNTFIIFLGTNSGLTDTLDTDVDPYQDYHDFTDNDTGCYCRMIEEILEARPNAIILLVNTWHVAVVQPTTRTTIDKIGVKYGLPVVETYDIMRYGVNPQYHGNVDNVHCSKAGYLALANLIIDKLDEYFSADISRVNKGMS